jgi:hypothetical protein
MSMKKCNDTIGNLTRDLPACSAVPQPTAPPAACHTCERRVLALIIYKITFHCLFLSKADKIPDGLFKIYQQWVNRN